MEWVGWEEGAVLSALASTASTESCPESAPDVVTAAPAPTALAAVRVTEGAGFFFGISAFTLTPTLMCAITFVAGVGAGFGVGADADGGAGAGARVGVVDGREVCLGGGAVAAAAFDGLGGLWSGGASTHPLSHLPSSSCSSFSSSSSSSMWGSEIIVGGNGGAMIGARLLGGRRRDASMPLFSRICAFNSC